MSIHVHILIEYENEYEHANVHNQIASNMNATVHTASCMHEAQPTQPKDL